MFRAVLIRPDEGPEWIHLPTTNTRHYVDQHLDDSHQTDTLVWETDQNPELHLATIKGSDEETYDANPFATSLAKAFGHDWDVYGPAILLAADDKGVTSVNDEVWGWIVNVQSRWVAAPLKPVELSPIVSFRELLAANPDTVTDDTEVIITAGELRARLDELGRLREQAEKDAMCVAWYLYVDSVPYEARLAELANRFGKRARAALDEFQARAGAAR